MESKDYITAGLAGWGALISTILGGVKLWETFWLSRIKLATSYEFSSEGGPGNFITLVNLSAVPVQVSHWSLSWEDTKRFNQKYAISMTFEEPVEDFALDKHSSRRFNLSSLDNFLWGYSQVGDRTLFMRVYLFGRRKPFKIAVYKYQ